ncbi:hypothetical protein D3C81_1447580 [compost metagenome]
MQGPLVEQHEPVFAGFGALDYLAQRNSALHMGNLLFQIDSIPAQLQALRQAYAAKKHVLEESRVDLAWPVRMLVEPGSDLVRLL